MAPVMLPPGTFPPRIRTRTGGYHPLALEFTLFQCILGILGPIGRIFQSLSECSLDLIGSSVDFGRVVLFEFFLLILGKLEAFSFLAQGL